MRTEEGQGPAGVRRLLDGLRSRVRLAGGTGPPAGGGVGSSYPDEEWPVPRRWPSPERRRRFVDGRPVFYL
jgi:hypothetical protein